MNLAKIDEVIKASPAIQIQSKISLLAAAGRVVVYGKPLKPYVQHG